MEKKDTRKIDLKRPIPHKMEDGSTVILDQITFGRLKAKHFSALPDDFMEREGHDLKPKELIPVIGALTDLPLETVGELDILDDFGPMLEAVQDFFGVSPETGETESSPSPTPSDSPPETSGK